MPKRSLSPGGNDAKKIEQLNRAIDGMLARADGKPIRWRQRLSRWCAWQQVCAICREKSSRYDLSLNC